MHPRIFIRTKAVELLLGNTDCGQDVYKQRSRPFIQQEGWQSELPAIVVYTTDESADKVTEAPAMWQRVVNLVVEVHAAEGPDTDDFLDHVAEQIEQCMGRYDWHLDDMGFDLSTTRMQLVEVGPEQVNGALAVTFPITYYSELPDAGKSDNLDDFKTAENRYRVGSAESNQTVNLP